MKRALLGTLRIVLPLVGARPWPMRCGGRAGPHAATRGHPTSDASSLPAFASTR